MRKKRKIRIRAIAKLRRKLPKPSQFIRSIPVRTVYLKDILKEDLK